MDMGLRPPLYLQALGMTTTLIRNAWCPILSTSRKLQIFAYPWMEYTSGTAPNLHS